MDNQNNNNSFNNPPSPSPISGGGFNPQTPDPTSSNQTPPSSFDPNANWQPPVSQTSPTWSQNPAPPVPVSPQMPTSYPNTNPVNTPQDSTPASTPTYSPPLTPLDTSPFQNQPLQPANALPPENVQPVTSPLDNPWGAPTQPPPIDGATPPNLSPDISNTYPPLSDQQTTREPQPKTPSYTAIPPWSEQPNPSIQYANQQGLENPNPPNLTEGEPAPTDLTHLINNSPVENVQPTASEAETLVAPTNGATTEVPNVPTEGNKGFPKWLIGVGIGLLIIVAGASAYFILGIGQTGDTKSIPAEAVPSQTREVKPPAPIPTPISQPAPQATGSANFGELGGSGTQQATSAADLLRQRQQQGQ